MENILSNNKEIINSLNQQAMTYMPAISLDSEISLFSNTYYSTVMSILHFGEGELNFRTGERYTALNLYPDLVNYFNDELASWNLRGISNIDNAIETIGNFIDSGILSDTSVSATEFADMRLRISEVLVQTPLKASDVSKLILAFDGVIDKASVNGEMGVVTYMKDKLIELKNVRLSPTRGTEQNIPVWKLIGAIIIFGFPVYKALRCILERKCCNTVSGLEGAIVFIAALAWVLC